VNGIGCSMLLLPRLHNVVVLHKQTHLSKPRSTTPVCADQALQRKVMLCN
jgi:hypothetical protein